jgi:hypothetical protein
MPSQLREVGSGRVVSRLNRRTVRESFVIRAHPTFGMFRITVVPLTYYDRGAGGFMAGRGEYITEGRVVCEPYPSSSTPNQYYAEKSVAGWGWAGEVDADSRQIKVDDPKPVSKKDAISNYNQEFWTLDEALSYANGDLDSAMSVETRPVKVSRRNGILTFKLDGTVIGRFNEQPQPGQK